MDSNKASIVAAGMYGCRYPAWLTLAANNAVLMRYVYHISGGWTEPGKHS